MQLSEERSVELDGLSETFADLLFGVEITKGNVFVTIGATRIDHRGKTPIRSVVPTARLVLTHALTQELAITLQAAAQSMGKVTGDSERAAISIAKPKPN